MVLNELIQSRKIRLKVFIEICMVRLSCWMELCAMGPVQFSWPRGVAENWFTKLGLGEHFVGFPTKTAKHRVHYLFFSPDPKTLLNPNFRDWPRSGDLWSYAHFNLPRPQSGNDREMTTSPPGHHWEAMVALTTTSKLQQLRANNSEMTTCTESYNKLSDPSSRNHKSLAIANHDFEVASFSRRNRSEIAVLEVFSESQWFFESRLQSLAICDSKSLRFGSLR